MNSFKPTLEKNDGKIMGINVITVYASNDCNIIIITEEFVP